MTSAYLRTMTQRHSYVRISITPTTAMVTRIATRGAVAITNAKYCAWWRHVRGVYRDQSVYAIVTAHPATTCQKKKNSQPPMTCFRRTAAMMAPTHIREPAVEAADCGVTRMAMA